MSVCAADKVGVWTSGAGGVWAKEGPSVDRPLERTKSELEEWAEEVTGDTGSGGDELGRGWGRFGLGV